MSTFFERFACLLLSMALVVLGAVAPAQAYTHYASEVPAVADWVNEPYALGGPSYCDETGCCASNAIANSGVWLTAHNFDLFSIPTTERIVSVVVGAYTRYDRNTVHCNVQLKVWSGVDVVPETDSGYYVWDQGNSGECRWVDWNITYLRPQGWTEYDVNNFRVAIRRFATYTTDTVCRVNGMRVVVTTEPILGACCLADHTCQMVTEDQCDNLNGDWDEDQTCSPCPCDVYCAVGPYKRGVGGEGDSQRRDQSGPDLGSRNVSPAREPYVVDFGSVEVGDSLEQSFTIWNGGCAVLEGYIESDEGDCDEFTIVSGDGSFSLPQYAWMNVVVRYVPSEAGSHVCTVDLGVDCESCDCESVLCAGVGYYTMGACCLDDGTCQVLDEEVCEGIPEATWVEEDTCSPCPCDSVCSVVPGALVFGGVEIGQHRDLSFVIRNPGCAVLNGDVAVDSEDFALVSGGGAFSLQQNQYRTVVVRYTPSDADSHFCDVTLGPDVCDDVSCDGEGLYSAGACCLDEGTCETLTEGQCDDLVGDWIGGVTCSPWPCEVVCEVSEEELDFGPVPVGGSETLSFVVRHTGGGVLTGNVIEACSAFTIVSGSGPFSLDPGDSLIVAVAFTPEEPGEEYECDIALGANCDSLYCSGEGDEGSGVFDLPGFRDGKDILRFQNPFPANAAIWLGTHQRGSAVLTICDVSGRRVRTVHSGPLAPGVYSFRWDGRDDDGRPVASGVYQVMSAHGRTRQHQHLVLLR